MKARLAFALVVAALAGCGDDSPVKPAPQGPMDAAGTVTALGDIYEARSLTAFTALLSDDFVFLRDIADPETGAVQWNATEELAVHARMFDPANIPAGDIPLDPDLWLEVLDVTLTPLIAFAERPDLYTAANPQGALDSSRWIARGATYATRARFELHGPTDYFVEGRAYFVVLEDRTKQIGEAGKFLLYRWEDMGQIPVGSDAPAVVPRTWSGVKSIYRRGRVAPPETPGLIDRLAESYRTRDLTLFSELLAADYRFILDQPYPGMGETDWGVTEERALHRRMFTPDDRLPSEPPVPADYVVQSIQITLTLESAFQERRDLYTTANPPGPLSPALWIARGAIYGTNVFFDLAGGTDFQVTGRAEFVVLENRYLQPSDPHKFVLYRWEDLGMRTAEPAAETSGVEEATWTGMKSLYRVPENLPPGDAPGLIEGLASAYRRLDSVAFEALLAPEYRFILDEPNNDGETSWGRITEALLHRRMLDPQDIPPGDPPLHPEYWLQDAVVTLSPLNEFAERPELYTTADPPGPLDPANWIARGATYEAFAYFQLQGEFDFQVDGRAYFTVLEDRTKQNGDPGKWLLYRWEDLGMIRLAVAPSWSDFKGLYRR